jgi:hypothetical protein
MKTRMAILIVILVLAGLAAAVAQETEMVIGGGYMKDKSELNDYIYGKLGVYWNIGNDAAIGLLADFYVNKSTMMPYFLDSLSLRLGWAFLNIGISSMIMADTADTVYSPLPFTPVVGLGVGIPFIHDESFTVRLEGVLDVYCVAHTNNTAPSADGEYWGLDLSMLDPVTKFSFGLTVGYGF